MRVRKSHKKSRSGCAQCKARRIKCDETKSKCVKCTIHNIPCSFSESPRRPASFQTDLQDDSVRTYDPIANDPMWYLDQNICERGVAVAGFSFTLLHVESWLNPLWSMQNLSLPNVRLLPALQSNPAFTAVNIEDSAWIQTQIMPTNLSSEFAGLNNTRGEFFIETWGSRNIQESSYQLPEESPTTMVHSMGEDLLLFPPSPAVAMEESILFEPNLEANLESDREQDAQRTPLHGVTPHADATSEHMEKITTSTKRSTL